MGLKSFSRARAIHIMLVYTGGCNGCDIEIVNAVRIWRFISLLLASFYGLYGVFLIIIFLLIDLSSRYSFGLSYTFPVSPYDKAYLNESLIPFT